MILGIAGLVHVTVDTAEIIDYKTDRTRQAEPEYCKQLSVYYHVLSEWFDGRRVEIVIIYTGEGEQTAIEPLLLDKLGAVMREKGSIESGEFRRFSVQLPAPRCKRRL
ncbi:hypothetical protein SAMN05216388_10302 [Halorientalis persicus]|uniref:PD-(D/E)XK nuclease superfamily protein n=1 Tax=Halorientalis persicus TaxID=1367881 RepID=A0A1H8URS2_9EURY|nr:hypothetical protein SAMN05216388_10302 [Halorientalis persicus]